MNYKKQLFILILNVLIIISNCKSEDIIKNMYNDGFMIKYKDEAISDSLTYTIDYTFEKDKKGINFYTNSLDDQECMNEYISVDKVVYDKKKNTVSFYKPDGLLIITLELLNNNKDARVIDYGKWLTWEEKYESTSLIESHTRFRFDGEGFKDSTKVYRSDFWLIKK